MSERDGIGNYRRPVDPSSFQPRAQHVWVSLNGLDVNRCPGLLLGWRRRTDLRRGHIWEGWVIWADPGIPAHGNGPHVRMGWEEASRITARE